MTSLESFMKYIGRCNVKTILTDKTFAMATDTANEDEFSQRFEMASDEACASSVRHDS